MSELKHPKWCDPVTCTAEPGLTLANYASRAVAFGAHRSAPVTLDTSDATCPPRQPTTAQLYRAHAPWLTTTYLVLRFGADEMSIPVRSAQTLVDQVVTLLWAEDESALPEGAPR